MTAVHLGASLGGSNHNSIYRRNSQTNKKSNLHPKLSKPIKNISVCQSHARLNPLVDRKRYRRGHPRLPHRGDASPEQCERAFLPQYRPEGVDRAGILGQNAVSNVALEHHLDGTTKNAKNLLLQWN